ncbi:MAG: hypothetical protein FJ096_13785 [Deltaproteobacteria bacterium]|nr:hypothetical protein [Deltaproteobacteria bacterium]
MKTNAPTDFLAESASGLRHLRWARELRGTVDGYLELHEDHDLAAAPPPRRAELDAAASDLSMAHAELGHAIERLSSAVKEYRDFLERRRTVVRGRARAALALGLAPDRRLAQFDATEREPRRQAVRAEVRWLREAVREVLARFERFPAIRASLLPPLADPHHVADTDDDDDDAAASTSRR